MWQCIRPRASALNRGRHAMRSNHQLHPRENRYLTQSVNFVKPPFRPRHFFINTTLLIGCALTYHYVVFGPLARFNDEMEKELDEDAKKELDGIEAASGGGWFIPFPGTTKKYPSPPYRGSDPEWAEYIRFCSDLEQGRRVRADLAEYLRSLCARDPRLTSKVGKPVKVRRYWLDFDFPLAPPPRFERSGLHITDEYIALATASVDAEAVDRLHRALWPSMLGQASIAFLKVIFGQLFGQTLTRVSTVFGVEAKPQPTFEELVALQKARRTTSPPGAGNGEIPSASTTRTRDPSHVKEPETPFAETPSKLPQGRIESETDDRFITSSFTQMQEHMSGARQAFRSKWAQVWEPVRRYPPRGSIILSGLIELEGPTGVLIFDAIALWDPKKKAIDTGFLSLELRRYAPKKLYPRRGP